MPKKSNKKSDIEKKFGESESESDEYSISLIPGKITVIPRVVKSRFFLLIASLIVVFTVFGIIWLYTGLHFEKVSNKVHKIRGEIRLLEGKTASFLELRDRISDLNKKATRVESILSDHIYWTRFFGLLEKYTIPSVYFGDFEAKVDKSINLQTTAEDLPALARQLVSFRKADDFVKKVKLSGIRRTPEGVAGVFELSLVEGVFKK